MELNITKDNFENIVVNSDKPVLIDFFATWCGPCSQLAPIVEKIAETHEEYLVVKINVDEEVELASKFGVVSIPTLVAMNQGHIVDKSVGVCTEEDILNMMLKA